MTQKIAYLIRHAQSHPSSKVAEPDWPLSARGREQAAQASIVSNQLRQTLAEKEYINADFYFRRHMYDPAIKYYEFVITLYPESAYAPQALLGIYLSNTAIGYDDLAEEARDRLLLEYPDSEAAATIRTDGTGV